MRLMAHGDALDMCGEGRHYAAKYLEELARSTDGAGATAGGTGSLIPAAAAAELREAAAAFRTESDIIWEAAQLLGGPGRGPEQLAALEKDEVRAKTADLILRAADQDALAAKRLGAARALLS